MSGRQPVVVILAALLLMLLQAGTASAADIDVGTVVSPWIGSGTTSNDPPTASGVGTEVVLNSPGACVTDLSGRLYVSMPANAWIYTVDPDTTMTQRAIGTGSEGGTDDTGTAAEVYVVNGFVRHWLDSYNILFTDRTRIRRIDVSILEVTTIVGPSTYTDEDYNEGTNSVARFHGLFGIARFDAGENWFVTEQTGRRVRAVSQAADTLPKTTSLVAGDDSTANPSAGTTDDTGNAARFTDPSAIVLTAVDGQMYVAEPTAGSIRIVTTGGVVTTMSPSPSISEPRGLALDNIEENLYVTCTSTHIVYRIALLTSNADVVINTAGTSGSWAGADVSYNAAVDTPRALCMNPTNGTLYVVGDHAIAKVEIVTATPTATVTSTATTLPTGTLSATVVSRTLTDTVVSRTLSSTVVSFTSTYSGTSATLSVTAVPTPTPTSVTPSLLPTPTQTASATATLTVPPTVTPTTLTPTVSPPPTRTATDSMTVSNTPMATLTQTSSSTATATVAPTPSETATHTSTVSVTVSPAPTRSATYSMTRTVSFSGGTVSASSSMSNTTSLTLSHSLSFTSTGTGIPTPTLTNTTTVTLSRSVSISTTWTPPPTRSETFTRSLSFSQTRSIGTQSATTTVSASGTNSSTVSIGTVTSSNTMTVSQSKSATPSIGTPTFTSTQTASSSNSTTPSIGTPTVTFTSTVSHSLTSTASLPPTPTLTLTRSLSFTVSQSASPSASESASESQTSSDPSLSYSESLPLTPSAEPTRSSEVTETMNSSSLSFSESLTFSQSESSSGSLSSSPSLSASSSMTMSESNNLTETESLIPTPSDTFSETQTRSFSSSISESSSLSLSTSVSESTSDTLSTSTSVSNSMSESLSSSVSESASLTLIPTPTDTISDTQSISQSESQSGPSATLTHELSESESESMSVTVSASVSPSSSVSVSDSQGSFSTSDSEPLTTSALPPTTTPLPTPTRSFMTRCPEECQYGLCNNRYPFKCVCFERPSFGFWAGSEFGGPCDRCKSGYFGQRCTRQCPGGACLTCTGHGECDDGQRGSGRCTCYNSSAAGYWDGNECAQCVQGFFGSSCQFQCDCFGPGTQSCDEGRFGSGACICREGYEGLRCDQCNSLLPSCVSVFVCPGPRGRECNNNGVCQKVNNQPKCKCNAFYATEDCGVLCPNRCSGHGNCSDGSDGDGRCTCSERYAEPDCATCRHGYFGTDCLGVCPGGVVNPCNNGTCNRVTGHCTCTSTFGGSDCTTPCPRSGANGEVCGGHGVCDPVTVLCRCHQDSQRGHWTGDTCDFCASTHGGDGCKTACPVDVNGTMCAGNGDCLNATARCECRDPFCGKFCDVVIDPVTRRCQSCPEPNMFGINCDQPCLCDLSHSNCTDGKSGDGSCECDFGWSGQYCNVSCPGGSSTPCSGHGTCDAATSTCTCDDGFGTATCAVGCVDPTCNGHGRCDDTASGSGQCVCDNGWVWPENGCVTVCDCNLHGTCIRNGTSTDLLCRCDDRFTGDRCQNCMPGLAGADCNTTCVNGRTNGTACDCNFGWAGPSCDFPCPQNERGVCSGSGTCLSSGICSCDNGFFGPTCGCSQAACKTESSLKQCGSQFDTCVCVGYHANPPGANDCTACRAGRWGASCLQKCPCNDHGTCDKDLGICQCTANLIDGYWGGANCERCLEGFMGTTCSQRSVGVTVLTSMISRHTSALAATYGRLDRVTNTYYAGGQRVNVEFNISNSILPSIDTVGSIQTPCATSGGDVYNVWPAVNQTLLYLMAQNASCNNVIRLYDSPAALFPGNRTLLSSNFLPDFITIDYSLRTGRDGRVCLVPRGTQELWCREPYASTPAYANPLDFNLIRGILYRDASDEIYVYGSNQFSRCYIVVTDSTGAPLNPQPFDVQRAVSATGDVCQIIDCATVTPSGFLVIGALTLRGGLLATFNISTGALVTSEIVATGTARCNAISFDPESNMGLAVYLLTMIKFRLSSVEVNSTSGETVFTAQPYGQQALPSNAIMKIDMYADQQTAYAPLRTSRGVEVMRFLLVDVQSVTPNVVDRIGGSVITVNGAGFRNVSTAFCRISSDIVPATVLSANQLTCIVPLSTSTETCLSQTVEVTMNNFTYTANNVLIDRPTSAVLTGIEPKQLSLVTSLQTARARRFAALQGATVSASMAAGQTITLTGRGFVKSDTATCRLTYNPDTGEYITMNATFDSPVRYFCTIPDNFNLVTYPGAAVAFAVDGQSFTATTVPFIVAGLAANIVVRPILVSNGSSSYVVFNNPPVTVATVDAEGNTIGNFDTQVRTVTITRESISGVALTLNGSTSYTMRNGTADLDGFWLERPNVGIGTFRVTVGVWSTLFDMELTSGTLVALRVVKQPFSPGDVIQPGALLPQAAEIQAVDAAGNVVLAEGIMLVTELVVHNATTGLIGADESKEFAVTPIRATGVASLAPEPVPLRFGHGYQLRFSLQANPLVNVTSELFEAGCTTSQFQVFDGEVCLECDTQRSICNGSAVMLTRFGHWRASLTSATFYDCPVRKACDGGVEYGGCREGYQGPMCDTCIEEWGKDFTRRCYECPSMGTSVAVIIILGVVFVLVLSGYVILTVQNWTAPTSRAGDSAIILNLFVTYLQTASLMEFFRYEWPKGTKRLFSTIGTAADFRFYTILASNCFFERLGFDATHVPLFYVAMFLFIVIVGVVVFLTLRAFPRIMLSTEAGVVRDQTLALMREAIGKPDATERQASALLEEHKFRTIMKVTTQIFVYFIVQGAAYFTFSLFSCRTVDYGDDENGEPLQRSLLSTDMRVDCEESGYKAVSTAGVFLAIVYILLFPCAVAAFIVYCQYQYTDTYYRLYTSFLTLGLRSERWYWSALVMFRKVLLVVPLVFIEEPVDMYLYSWILTFFTWLTHMRQPYAKWEHARLDLVLCISIIICANLGMAMRVLDDPLAETVLGWLVVSLSIVTMLYVAFLWGMIWIFGTVRKRRAVKEWVDEDKTGLAIDLKRDVERQMDLEAAAADARGARGSRRFDDDLEFRDEFEGLERDAAMAASRVRSPRAAGGDRGPGALPLQEDPFALGDSAHHAAAPKDPFATSTTAEREQLARGLRGSGESAKKRRANERAGAFGGMDVDDDLDALGPTSSSSPRRNGTTTTAAEAANTSGERHRSNFHPPGTADPARRRLQQQQQQQQQQRDPDALEMDIDAFLDANCDGADDDATTVVQSSFAAPSRPNVARPQLLDQMMRQHAASQGRTPGRYELDRFGRVVDTHREPNLHGVGESTTESSSLDDLPIPGQQHQATSLRGQDRQQRHHHTSRMPDDGLMVPGGGSGHHPQQRTSSESGSTISMSDHHHHHNSHLRRPPGGQPAAAYRNADVQPPARLRPAAATTHRRGSDSGL